MNTFIYNGFMVGLFFFLGAVFASFFEATFYRLDHNMSIISTDRSECDVCGNTLKWYENVPVLSYSMLDGESLCCSNPIDVKYPLSELTGAVVAAISYFSANPVINAVLMFLGAMVVLSDIDSKTIYRFLLIMAIGAALIRYYLIGGAFISLLVVFAILVGFAFIIYILNHRRGFGDFLFSITAGIVAGTNLPSDKFAVATAISHMFIFLAIGSVISILIAYIKSPSGPISKGLRVAATPMFFAIIAGFII